jgi:beta-fructofuranosidase
LLGENVIMPSNMADTYGPKGKLLWDSWFFKKDGEIHVFYLQAKPTDNPYLKHDVVVSIGHAVSKDLYAWTELPAVLEPGRGGVWDNLALWTGCVIERGGRYYMFYTGRNSDSDKMWIQKIGAAESGDLIHWEKNPQNPILEAKGWYVIDNYKNKLGKIGTWRDPFVFYHEKSARYCMTISARAAGKEREYNACVALAVSADLKDWKLEPPVFSPGVYDEIEGTQIIEQDGLWYLFFSTHAENYRPEFAKKIGGQYGGLHCYYAKDFAGPYEPVNVNGVVLSNGDKMYDVRLIEGARSGEYRAIGWLKTEQGKYSGKLSSPFDLKIKGGEISATIS